MILAANAVSGSSISYKGYTTSATTSITLPSHATGDLIIVFARGGTSTLTIPAGWTPIGSTSNKIGSAGGISYTAAAYKLAASGSEVSGTWTNATYMLAGVYDGVASVGTATWWDGGSTTWSGITVGGTESWVAGLGFFYDGTGYDTPPTGMTHRGASSTRIALHDTASVVAAWNVQTTTGTYGKSGTYVLELVSV